MLVVLQLRLMSTDFSNSIFRTTARTRTRPPRPPRGPRGARRSPRPRESTPPSPKLEVGRETGRSPLSCNFPRLHECKGRHVITSHPSVKKKLCKELNSNLEPRKRRGRRRRRELGNGRSLHLELSNCHEKIRHLILYKICTSSHVLGCFL